MCSSAVLLAISLVKHYDLPHISACTAPKLVVVVLTPHTTGVETAAPALVIAEV
jgi:hypothetical protein